MRFRTFLGILLAVVAAIAVAYVSNLNSDLLQSRFSLTPKTSVALHVALLAAFLMGFLPTVSVLLGQTLKKDLASRRGRRQERQVKSLDMAYRRAVDYQSDGLWKKAAAELTNLLAERPEDFSALLRYGEVLRKLGRSDEALEVHRKASVLYPRSVAVLYQLADDYDSRGESEVGEQIRDRILRDFPGQGLKELRQRRNVLLNSKSWVEAERIHEAIEKQIEERAGEKDLEKENAVRNGLAYQRAVGLLEEDRHEEAKKLLSEILEKEALFVPALLLEGEVERLQDRPDGAIAAWRRGFEVTGSPVFLLRIEDHFIERNEPLEAISTLHALRDVSTSDLLPRFFLGRLYYRLEMHEEAWRSLAGLAEELDGSPTFHFVVGRVQQKLGNLSEAVESYQACLRRAGISAAEFVCRACGRRRDDWSDRCVDCGTWNSIDLDFREEPFSAEELGVKLAPVEAVYDAYKSWNET